MMDYTTIAALTAGVSAVALIQGLVKVAKEAGLNSKYAPILAIALGLALGVPAALVAGMAWYYGISAGVSLGLMACGIYSTAQSNSSTSSTTTTDNSGTTTPTV